MKKDEKYLLNVQKNIIQDYQKTFDWIRKQDWCDHTALNNYTSSFIYHYEDVPSEANK